MMVIVLLISVVSIVLGQTVGGQSPGGQSPVDIDALVKQVELYRQSIGKDDGGKLQDFRADLMSVLSDSGKISGGSDFGVINLRNDQCLVVSGQLKCGVQMSLSLAPTPKVEVPKLDNVEKRVISYSGTEIFVPLVRLLSYVAFIFFIYGAIRNLLSQNIVGAMQNVVMLIFVVGLLWFLGR